MSGSLTKWTPGEWNRIGTSMTWRAMGLVLMADWMMNDSDELDEIPPWQGALYVTWLIVLAGLSLLAVP